MSAGEISAYIVCPESWRLKVIERAATARSERATLGRELHQEWAAKYDESLHLLTSSKVVIVLVAIAIGIFVLTSLM